MVNTKTVYICLRLLAPLCLVLTVFTTKMLVILDIVLVPTFQNPIHHVGKNLFKISYGKQPSFRGYDIHYLVDVSYYFNEWL